MSSRPQCVKNHGTELFGNIWYPFSIHLKLKSNEISSTHNHFLCSWIIFEMCAELFKSFWRAEKGVL